MALGVQSSSNLNFPYFSGITVIKMHNLLSNLISLLLFYQANTILDMHAHECTKKKESYASLQIY